jgi:hypothetical protein
VSSCDPWELHPQATFRAMAAYAVPGAEYKVLRAGTSERIVKYRVQGPSSHPWTTASATSCRSESPLKFPASGRSLARQSDGDRARRVGVEHVVDDEGSRQRVQLLVDRIGPPWSIGPMLGAVDPRTANVQVGRLRTNASVLREIRWSTT